MKTQQPYVQMALPGVDYRLEEVIGLLDAAEQMIHEVSAGIHLASGHYRETILRRMKRIAASATEAVEQC